MFQNIKEGQAKGKHRGAGVFANVFSIQNIPLYIISFMTSIVGVGTGGQVSPFGISMMAACMGNSVPILGVVLAGILGNAIGFELEGAITYLVISIVFVLSTFIIKPLYQEEEKNERYHTSEFRYGKYQRTISFDAPIKPDESTAEYKDGLLTIIVPKQNVEQTKPKKLKINSKDENIKIEDKKE